MEVRKGIDISRNQQGISFEAIKKAGVDFVIIRAGCGMTKDSFLDNFIAECKMSHLKFGFYWYSYALTIKSAIDEAKACIEAIKMYNPAYPVYYDQEDKSQIEYCSTQTRTNMAIKFCNMIKSAGYTPGIYANPSWFENYYQKNKLLGKYDIWLAHWTENPNKRTTYNYGQRVWQWGLDNIGGFNVDGDLSYYDYPTPNSPEFRIGDIVMFMGGLHYVSSTAENPTGFVGSKGLAEVVNVASDAPHKYALRGVEGDSNVFGWVDQELVKAAEEKLTVGDNVKVKSGAKTYNGGNLASYVYNNTYVVMQIGSGVAPDYIVIGTGRQITAAVRANDLIKVFINRTRRNIYPSK